MHRVGLRLETSFLLCSSCKRNVLCYRALARRLGVQQLSYALQARGLDDEQEPQTQVEAMARDYLGAVRTVQSHGPYLLGGWSIGGLIAFEMARQLQAQGEEVRLLALFDTKAPNAEGELEVIDDAYLTASFALHLGMSTEQLQDVAEALSQAQTKDYLPFTP